MTTLTIRSAITGRRNAIQVPLSFNETVERIQAALADPVFEVLDFGPSIYARVAGGTIEVVVYWTDDESAVADLNRVIGRIGGRVRT